MFAHITEDRKDSVLTAYARRLVDDDRNNRVRMIGLSDDQMDILAKDLAKRLTKG